MKRRILSFGAALALCLLFSSAAFAGGYSVYEWSARGDAVGGAMIAHGDDASMAAYNPAGLTRIEDKEVIIGTAVLSPDGKVSIAGEVGEQIKDIKHVVPHGYGAIRVNDRVVLGIAAHNRFGLSNQYDEEWIGRYNTYHAAMTTYSVTPSVALQLSDELSFGFGIEMMYASVDLRKRLVNPGAVSTPSADFADTKLTGKDYGIGLVMGLTYEPTDWLTLGVVGRSPVELSLEGELQVEQINPGISLIGTYSGYADLDLPGSVGFGVAVEPMDKLVIEADLMRTFWSSYKDLDVNYSDATIEAAYGTPKHKDWRDVWRLQVGAEYAYSDELTLRAGYVYDEAPNKERVDYMMFPGDKQIVFGGIGYNFGQWTVDASYGYLWGEEVNTTVKTALPGGVTRLDNTTFEDVVTHLINLSVKYTF